MATKKKKAKKVEDAVETSPATTDAADTKKPLDLTAISIPQAKVPPAHRLFPSALLSELDDIKERLEEIEKTLGIGKNKSS